MNESNIPYNTAAYTASGLLNYSPQTKFLHYSTHLTQIPKFSNKMHQTQFEQYCLPI